MILIGRNFKFHFYNVIQHIHGVTKILKGALTFHDLKDVGNVNKSVQRKIGVRIKLNNHAINFQEVTF